jgi:Spy/CpxP family protein refolding chaperone
MIPKLNSSISRLTMFLILTVTAAMVLLATSPSHAKRRQAPAAAGSANAFVADKGKFRIMVNGQKFGT